MNFAYIRVSTDKQSTDRQTDILKQYPIDKVFEEKVSGKNRDREQLDALLNQLRANDVIYVESFSRLARNTKDLINIVEELSQRQVILISHKEKFDTSTPTGKLMLTMLAALSQFERDIIVERTKEGLNTARARGKVGGRKPKEPKQVEKALRLYDSKTLKIPEICEATGISKPTLYRYLADRKAGASQCM